MNDPIRIFIVDDHPVVRDGLAAILSTQADFQVVGEAANGSEALSLLEPSHASVILLDLEMPGMDGVEVIQHTTAIHPQMKIVVFTAFDTDDRILGALAAGAKGYLLKGAPRAELFSAIRIVHQGGSLLQPIVATRLISQLQETKDRSSLEEDLTARELEVLGLLAKGKQNKEIGAELFITERTVKFHISAILAKLDAGNRTEAVTIALQHELITL